MKRIMVELFMVLMVCFTLTGCGKSSSDSEKNERESSFNREESVQKANLGETVIVDKNDLKITVKSIDYSSMFGPEMKVLIENNSSQNVTIQVRDFAINDIMMDPMFYVDVAAGKEANDTIAIPNSSLKTAKITTIKDIEFDVDVSDSNSWEDIFTESDIQLQTDAKDYVQIYNTEGTLVVDQKDVKIYVLDDKDTSWGTEIYVYIENNSDQDITVQVRDVSINGFMVDPAFSSDVTVGKKAYDSIPFFESDLKDNKNIKDLELKFNVSSRKNWDTIFETDNIKVNF